MSAISSSVATQSHGGALSGSEMWGWDWLSCETSVTQSPDTGADRCQTEATYLGCQLARGLDGSVEVGTGHVE
jgi:hypothetical protein